MTEQVTLAIIGGSGLYSMPGLEEPRQYDIDTPFGKTSGNTSRQVRARAPDP